MNIFKDFFDDENLLRNAVIIGLVVVAVVALVSCDAPQEAGLLFGVFGAMTGFDLSTISTGKLSKKTIVLYPYEKVAEEDFPTFLNEEGKREKLPAGWRNVGYEYPYPTVTRVAAIRKKLTDMSLSANSGGLNITRHDPEELMKHLAFNLIRKIVQKDPETGEISEKNVMTDIETKRWLVEQFQASSFLFVGAYSEYLAEGEDVRLAEIEEEEDFLDGQKNTSNSKSSEPSSDSTERPQPSNVTNLETG